METCVNNKDDMFDTEFNDVKNASSRLKIPPKTKKCGNYEEKLPT